jgi:hypothetical protein
VKIGVHHAKAAETGGKISGSHPNLDRAVAAKHKVALARRNDVTDSVPHTGDILDDGVDILRTRICAIGPPSPHRKITMINDLDPGRC